MRTTIATALLSATCLLGLSACGGLIQVQRAVEAKGYEVEKVGVRSDGSGRTLTVYVEQNLDAAQKQEVKETAHTVYPKAKEVEVKKATGSSGSSGSSKSNGGSKPNSKGSPSSGGARKNQ